MLGQGPGFSVISMCSGSRSGLYGFLALALMLLTLDAPIRNIAEPQVGSPSLVRLPPGPRSPGELDWDLAEL